MEKETMLGRIVVALNLVPAEMLGTVIDLLNHLTGEKGQEMWKNLKHLLRGEFEIKLPSLINWLGITTTSATTKPFIAKDKFRKDSKEVKFYGFFGSFEEDFLSGDGKVEKPLGEQALRYGDLIKNSVDGPIIAELGGEEKAETTLTELYDKIVKQGQGQEEGELLTNGRANIFYISPCPGVLRAVLVFWYDVGWRLFSYPVTVPRGWGAGIRIFSRNS